MNNITSTIAMNDIVQGSNRTPEITSTISTNGVAKDGNDNPYVATISKPGAKTNFNPFLSGCAISAQFCIVTSRNSILTI